MSTHKDAEEIHRSGETSAAARDRKTTPNANALQNVLATCSYAADAMFAIKTMSLGMMVRWFLFSLVALCTIFRTLLVRPKKNITLKVYFAKICCSWLK